MDTPNQHFQAAFGKIKPLAPNTRGEVDTAIDKLIRDPDYIAAKAKHVLLKPYTPTHVSLPVKCQTSLPKPKKSPAKIK